MSRESTDAAALLKREIRSLSLGRDLDKAARRGLNVRVDNAAIVRPYARVLTTMFEPRFPWER